MIEARWFYSVSEALEQLEKVGTKRRRVDTEFIEGEIIESELLDDIPAVSNPYYILLLIPC